MKSLRRSDDFNADVQREWVCLHQSDELLAGRFIDGVEESLRCLAQQPGAGHPGRYRHPRLRGLRAWAVAKAFQDWLIFYWDRPDHAHLFRLIHDTRDLPRRLVQGETESRWRTTAIQRVTWNEYRSARWFACGFPRMWSV